MSEFVAILAWISFFGLIWAMLISDKFQNPQAVAAACLFAILALVSSSMATKKKEEPK